MLSGDTAIPFGNRPLSITLRSMPSREYWYTAPVWSVRFGPGPVPHGSVKNRLPSASKSRSLGPLIGVTMFPPFLAKGNNSTVEDYVAAIDYVIRVAGEDNVGIGTDFTQDHDDAFFSTYAMTKAMDGE